MRILISVTTPVFGFGGAVQFSALVAGGGAAAVSIICLIIALFSPSPLYK